MFDGITSTIAEWGARAIKLFLALVIILLVIRYGSDLIALAKVIGSWAAWVAEKIDEGIKQLKQIG